MTDTLFTLDGAPAADSADAAAGDTGQWRLAEVQVANWGTFHGSIHRMAVSRRGHLLTGPSGSGKSSLLDAIAAVLTPGRYLRFNEAAQGGGTRANNRSILSYVRGAWSRQNDEHEDRVVAAYLRPTSTWSGIVLRYEDGDGNAVTAARLFFLRGTSTSNADLTDMCLLERAAVDLEDLQEYARSGIEMRKAKARWPHAVFTTGGNHGTFYTRLRAALGISTEATLRLLHKTQSAKSLNNLDDLFRSYMLDDPKTFAIAKDAVEQFGELDDAHKHVVQLREQRDHLRALASAADRFATADAVESRTAELAAAVPAYQKRRETVLTKTELTRCTEETAILDSAAQRTAAEHAEAEDRLRIARQVLSDAGGDEINHLTSRIADAEARTHETANRRDRFAKQLGSVGITAAPTTEREHAELLTEIARADVIHATVGPTHEQLDRLHRARTALESIDAELDALCHSQTTVPSALLAVRDQIAATTGLPASALPFGAELIEIHPEHAAWTGAIERVLRPFALSILVRSDHLPAVRRWVDSHHTGTRVVYEEVPPTVGTPRPPRTDLSLVRRVAVADSHVGKWVATQLAERFDLACVETADELDNHDRAVTLNGQIRTSRTRYEKDDRTRLDDRSRWVLGDREGKHEALVAARRAAAAEMDAATAVVTARERHQREAQTRAGALLMLRDTTWAEIDVTAATARVDALRTQLNTLTESSGDLAAAQAAVTAAADSLAGARDAAIATASALSNARAALATLEHDLVRLESELSSGAFANLSDDVTVELDRRFRKERRQIDRTTLAETGQAVERALGVERLKAAETAAVAAREGTTVIVKFRDRWPAAARDLTDSFDDRSGYLELLDSIVAHGLPDHEDQFFRLLRERSRDLVGHLHSEITGALQEIETKLDDVNTSLQRSPFDTDRYLRLRPKQLRSPTVTQFLADLRSITEGAWGDDDAATAETRFATLASLMKMLGSSDYVDVRMRKQCLDTREHVTFLADEIDAQGRIHATYDSGAAMSGGQQQKLVVFCLAAALRYQLAEPDEARPRYGTVIFDEAFDKADARYTRMALDVFVEFGFQLVLATPQKLLQTIEPYVGAITSVENPTRRSSRLAAISWEHATTGIPAASAPPSDALETADAP